MKSALSALCILVASLLLNLPVARAEDAPAPANPPARAGEGVETEVKNLRQRYWARGDTTELEVIQNRQYKKLGKFRLGVAGGIVATDPFLSVKDFGGSVGYYFGENWALQFTGTKYFVSSSSALQTLELTGNGTLLNRPKAHYALEALVSPLYGKLSFFGNKILYFDFYLLGGLGMLSGENGTSTAPHLGIGQQVYLTRTVALSLEVRLLRYKENLTAPATVTVPTGTDSTRTNYTWTSQLGLAFML